ncbi:MAG: SdpI family protein [Chloroherpetonaceae bacterium]|nr:SdpI family protein [Chthonomonadaceae bacterium]MDW8207251.1 SdpI family protein [Chloroherpetonaceae bacterium]
MWKLALLFVLSGALIIGLAIPMIQRKVAPNPVYGFRTPKTLSSPDIWYPANEYSGRLMAVAGGVTILGAILLALWPGLTAEQYLWGGTAVLLSSLGWAVWKSFQFLNRL